MEPEVAVHAAKTATMGACLLTVAGGMMDAWVYLAHGHLFANAQTGNVVLFAIHLTASDLAGAARTLWPIAAFLAGLLLSRLAAIWLKTAGLNSRNLRLSVECVALLVLAVWAAKLPDNAITACVGFIAAVQITSLSHIGGASFNTGVTTGNLRSAVTALVAAWHNPAAEADREKAAILVWLCLAFPVGALAGGVCTPLLGDATVFVIAGLVACAILVLWRTPDPIPRDDA